MVPDSVLPPARVARIVCLALAVLIAEAAWAHAQSDERVSVRIDGRAVLRVSGTDEDAPAERAQRIERKIAMLLEQPQAVGPARVDRSAQDPSARVIVVSGVPLVTVTTEDAEDNLTSVDKLAAQWAQAMDGALERARGRRLSAGGRFASEVQAAVEAAFGRLADSAIRIVPRTLAALLVIALFWTLAVLVRWLMRLLFHRFIEDLTIENLLIQVAYYAVWVLGLLVALDAFGFDPATVVTGLGLTSLALGFALKDILSNFVSGLLILTLRSFRLGDQIVIGDTEGSVERIELRATQIRTYDGRAVIVPNAELLTSRIVNNTAGPVRRASIEIVLGYEAAAPQVHAALHAAMRGADGVLETPAPSVRIRELTPDGIVFEGRFWTDSRRSDFLATTSRVAEAVVTELRRAGVPLPQPAERLLVPGQPPKWRDALGITDHFPRARRNETPSSS